MDIKNALFAIVLGLCLLFLLNTASEATLSSVSPSLSQSLEQADVIVDARLVTYQAGPKSHDGGDQEQQDLSRFHLLLKPAGTYKFEILKQIKGHTGKTLQIALPALSLEDYHFAPLHIEPGARLLLILSKSASGGFLPVDKKTPFIPLADSAQMLAELTTTNSQVVHLMLASLTDPALRKANTYLLRQVVDSQIPVSLVDYIEDPDIGTRDAVLYCLATNQQVAVIPRIARLEAEQEAKEQVTLSIQSLQGFNTVEAIPYLNHLLWDNHYYTRLDTMFAFANVSNQTSIPYLMLALHDPDPQQIIPSGAWGLLHDLIPSLGSKYQDNQDFYSHRKAKTQPIYDWWNDELNGKHLKPADKPPVSADIPDTVSQVNPLLFLPYASTRQAAIVKLQKIADKTSIPYLMLALQDPDNVVSYGAYITLYKVAGIPGSPVPSSNFEAQREAATQPIYVWWNDELLGKHVQHQLHPFQAPIKN